MLFEGKNVSERIMVPAVVVSIGESKKNPGNRYINFCTPAGEFGCRLWPDVDAQAFVGHSAILGLRMFGPEYSRSQFDRVWICDMVKEAVPF